MLTLIEIIREFKKWHVLNLKIRLINACNAKLLHINTE